MTLDLDAYLTRIGHRGPTTIDHASLSALLLAHMTRIPFENLDVLLGRPISLELDALQAKLVHAGRGGYCYEHATLFAAVLEKLGFTVATHSARVTMMRPKHESPRTHMFLTVELRDGTYVVDPGFGGLAPRVPLHLDGRPAEYGGDEHWLSRDSNEYVLEARTPERIVGAWTSTLSRDFPVDFEMANYFTSTHPISPFTTRLMMRTYSADARVTIANRTVTRHRNGASEVTQLADGAALRAAVARDFGFDLPELASLKLPA